MFLEIPSKPPAAAAAAAATAASEWGTAAGPELGMTTFRLAVGFMVGFRLKSFFTEPGDPLGRPGEGVCEGGRGELQLAGWNPF